MTKVFFYGLFMDENLLAENGVPAANAVVGFVDGYCLTIGERATLRRQDGARAYGVMMEVPAAGLKRLYAQPSVADYVAEAVTVERLDGRTTEALCYNLPAGKTAGTNVRYAEALLEVARRAGLPDSYLAEIAAAAGRGSKRR